MATIRKVVGQITLKVLVDVESTTYFYLLMPSIAPAPSKPTTNPPTIYQTDGYSGWNTTEPGYTSGDTRSLYVTVRTVYSDGSFDYTVPSLSSSYEAAKEAYNRAQSAMSLAGDMNQYFWEISSAHSTNVPAGVYVTSIPQNSFKSNPSGGNILIQNTGLTIRNGITQLASLTGSALNFYNPQATSGQNSLQLSIGANGILQSGNYTRGSNSKFSSNGTKIDLINGDIITKYFRVSQGLETGLNAGVYVHGTIEALDGTIGTDTTNYWEIGNGTDYNLHDTAKIIGHGSSYIQLGDNSTWRLATNRIHTGWYTSNDSLLHYPSISSKYWDFGIHAPSDTAEKFLYIRKSKANTSASNALTNLLYDIDDTYATPQWDYVFYISADGSLYARNLYVLDDSGNATQIGGTDGVYLLKSGGTMTGSITMSNGGKFIGDLTGNADTATTATTATQVSKNLKIQLNSGTTEGTNQFTYNGSAVKEINITKSSIGLGNVENTALSTWAGSSSLTTAKVGTLAEAATRGVDTSISAASTSTKLPTSAAVAAFVEGKGYLTSYTETDPTVPSWAKAASKPSYALSEITGADDVKVIEALTGTSGFLKKTAANTWTLDTNTYLTSYAETDPVFVASAAYGISSTDISNWNSKTSNTGTVTKVTAGTGLSIGTTAGGNFTTSGTINHTNSVTAQTTQGIYPIKIDAQGHISAYGSAPTTLSGYGITDAVPSSRKVAGHALSSDITLSKSDVGLGNVINTKQITNITNEFKDGQNTGKLVIWRGESDSEVLEVQITAREATSAINATNAEYATYDASEASNTTKTTIANKYIPKSIGTAAGDIIYWSASGTPTRLAKGSNGQVLKLANGVPTWGTDNNDNTTYSLSGSLSSHKFTTTLTPSSGSATTSAFTIAAGSNISLTDSGTTITITATDTNTATAVDNILDGSNSGTAITYAPYTARADKLMFYTGTTAPNGTTRLNLNGHLYATKLYSNGSEVLTSHQDISGKIDTAGTGLSKSGTTLNHANSITAQTTQAVYPIKIDAQGHISGYGSAQTILSLGTDSSNAYRGDYGNTAYIHATDSGRLTTATASGFYKFSVTAHGHVGSVTTVTASDITGLLNFGTAYNASSNKIATISDVTSAINGATNKYVTLDTAQTLTATATKTFNGAIRWGTTSKYGAAHYDSTLEAIVFSFA